MSSIQDPTAIEDKNAALLDEILDLLDSPDCENPEVILLVGRSGAGKSALVNTIHKVLTGKYLMIAEHGSGDAATVTTTLNRYDNCGVLSNRIADGQRREKMLDKIKKLPHILDCAGLADENSRKLRDIIELLLGGYIPPDTSMLALEEMHEKYGEGGLRTVFSVPNPAWRVTKIVFMQGCIDAIPKNILECLKEILNMYDKTTLTAKYQCRLFVLITKYDLVKESSDVNLHGESRNTMFTSKDLENVELEIAKQLSLIGAMNYKIIRWVSFSDNIERDNPHIEKSTLTFLKKMVEPGVPRARNTKTMIGSKQRIALGMYRLRKQISIHIHRPQVLILAAIMIAVLAYTYYLLQQTATRNK